MTKKEMVMKQCSYIAWGAVVVFALVGCKSTPEIEPAAEYIFSALGRQQVSQADGRTAYVADNGKDVISGLQYYVSRRIVLTRVSNTKDNRTVSGGVGRISIGDIRNTFTIDDSTPGVVLPSEAGSGKVHAYRNDDGRLVLEIAFETSNNYTINFVQDDPDDPKSLFHIAYTNSGRQEIAYGVDEKGEPVVYKVSWPTLEELAEKEERFDDLLDDYHDGKKEAVKKVSYYDEPPLLLVEVHIDRNVQEQSKKASGRRVQN